MGRWMHPGQPTGINETVITLKWVIYSPSIWDIYTKIEVVIAVAVHCK